MADRKYYHDSTKTNFSARILGRQPNGPNWDIILDETFFYPTSGGQPYDMGFINEIPVVDVQVREPDGEILHTVTGQVTGEIADCQIDWNRRFDHMQQHTGQHILSAAFEQIADAETIGFHLGAEVSTIDLDMKEMDGGTVKAVEDLSNKVIFDNRPVRVYEMEQEQVRELPLRKQPAVKGQVRIVHVQDLDYSPCGGTHVSNTGEIGLLKIVNLESRSRGLRVEFLCGWRAVNDYRTKHDLITHLANDLTTSFREIDRTVERLVQENKNFSKDLQRANEQLLEYQALELAANAKVYPDFHLVIEALADMERQNLGILARKVASGEKMIALLGLAGEKSHFVFSRSPDVQADMVVLLKSALEFLGSKSGGGRPDIAQGGGPPADRDRIWQALRRAAELLLGQDARTEKDNNL